MIDDPAARRLPILLGLLAGLAALALLLYGPIPQDLEYHCFADGRRMLGIPNFWNVVSNLPFLLVGLLGLRRLSGVTTESRLAWQVFYASVFLVGFGSSWYHLEPDNETLVWDRLPMAAGFMALFCAYLGEHLDRRFLRWLRPLVGLGILSVLDWAWRDDLRLYAFVQFFPMLGLLLMLLLLPSMRAEARTIGLALLAYGLAKLLEAFDHQIVDWTGGLASGHPWKHVAAAFGPWFLLARFPKTGA